MVSDPIGDYIIRLQNAGRSGRSVVDAPYSKLRHAVADKLCSAGYLSEVVVEGGGTSKILKSVLTYTKDGNPAINGVKRVSKPGRRIYQKVQDIYPVKFGRGEVILSTPAGLMTGSEARSQNMGGEQLFIIW